MAPARLSIPACQGRLPQFCERLGKLAYQSSAFCSRTRTPIMLDRSTTSATHCPRLRALSASVKLLYLRESFQHMDVDEASDPSDS